jgi:hypothetical protein
MEDDSSQGLDGQTSSNSPQDVKPCIDGRTSSSKESDPEGRSKNHIPPWSGASWQDGSRKSAFQPYRVSVNVQYFMNIYLFI